MGIRFWIYKLFHKRVIDTSQSEIELITTELIEETKVVLQKRFDELISKHTEPLSEEEARVILDGMIKEAVAKRKLLPGRIEKSVEIGSLFERYYGKMQTINALTNSAYAQMQKMNIAKERYEFQCAIYKKLTKKMYEPDAIPDEHISKKSKKTNRDVWDVMEEQKKMQEDEGGK